MSSREEPEQGGTVSQLVVTDARLEDSGAFTCTASNSHGVRTSHLHLLVQGEADTEPQIRSSELHHRRHVVTKRERETQIGVDIILLGVVRVSKQCLESTTERLVSVCLNSALLCFFLARVMKLD